MKQKLIFSLFAASAAFATSCDNNNDWDLPNLYTYATVMELDDTETTSTTEGSNIYFQRDNGETFNIAENKSIINYSKLDAGTRVVAGVTLYESDNAAFDNSADLYELYSVFVGTNEIVTTEEESDAIADDTFDFIATDVSLTLGYLNLFVGITAKDTDDIGFYLVENLIVNETDDSDGDYLALELRYDSAGAEGSGSTYSTYVSFDMSSFEEKLEGKDGIILRAKTLKNESIDITIESDNLFPAE